MKNEIDEVLKNTLGASFSFTFAKNTNEGTQYRLSSTVTKKTVMLNFFKISGVIHINLGDRVCELNERNLLLALFLTVYLT